MYYLRSRAAADAIKFTVDTAMLKVVTIKILCTRYHIIMFILTKLHLGDFNLQEKPKTAVDDDTKMAQMVCSLTNREDCLSCGS